MLEALDNTNSAREKLERDHHSERLKAVLGLAGEAAKSVNPDSFVNRRKQLDEMEAKFDAQVDALNFFSHKFQELVEEYCHSYPTQVEQALRETLRKLDCLVALGPDEPMGMARDYGCSVADQLRIVAPSRGLLVRHAATRRSRITCRVPPPPPWLAQTFPSCSDTLFAR